MKLVIRRVAVERIDGDEIRLEDLVFNGKQLSLNVINKLGRLDPDSISFMFNKEEGSSGCEYQIIIDNKGIRFERFVLRPNHDHNDWESLQVVVEKGIGRPRKGELVWRDYHPNKEDGYAFFYVPFGGVTIDY